MRSAERPRRETGSEPRSGRVRIARAVAALLLHSVAPLAAQVWNDSAAVALVERGIAARARAEPDSSLISYHTRAHGFLFFLAQAGRQLQGPPRLIKADELDVDVYWRAPATSRQVILRWRDGRWLPTDVHYHRDHLGIVTSNFGDRIRIGEGDEVKDVVHPLAALGPSLYDYRLSDSVRVRTRDGTLLLREVEVRPRDPAAPRVIGTLSLDVASGDLVRFRFSFTPSAYLDPSLEDISIGLENARVEQRWWLPFRQEVEIRRRMTWLDFPARSIIRGRWEIGDYDLNVAVPSPVLAGPAIGGLRAPRDTGGAWTAPLASAIADVERPVDREALDAVRDEVTRLAEGRMLSGLPRARLGLSAISDLARVNRVQGLALGAGAAFQAGPSLVFRPRLAFGTSDGRLLADLAATWTRPRVTVTFAAGRRLLDFADQPVASGVVSSLLAQEGGRDLGDYVLRDAAALSAARRLGGSAVLTIQGGVERARSVRTEASPAHGSYRPNPALGAGTLAVARTGLEYHSASLTGVSAFGFSLSAEGGVGDREYLRGVAALEWLLPAGPGGVRLRAESGIGSRRLPAYRSFAIGGWGTLPGEPFRAWGGRRMALASLEYRVPVPFAALPLGSFVSTGAELTLAPFLSAGWAGGGIAGLPWRASGAIRPVAGLAIEWFHHLIRVEGGVSLRTGKLGVSVDLARAWWEIL